MKFKELIIDDIDKIVSIYIDAFNAPPWNDKWSKDRVYKRLKPMINNEDSYGLVCYENNTILGVILGHYEYYYNTLDFEIKEFFVNTSIQGKGIGKALFNEFNRRLKENGVGRIFLTTTRANKTIGFYKGLGFDSEDDLLIMVKNLLT